MDSELQSQFDRAEELVVELKEEYLTNLSSKKVTERARNLTHEVLTKIRGILDQAMRRFFDENIAPDLLDQELRRAKVYFPITRSPESLSSRLRGGKMRNLEQAFPKVYRFIQSVQPYTGRTNKWLEHLNTYAVEGKHIRLTPQVSHQTKQLTMKLIAGGQKIDVDSGHIVAQPCVIVKKETWILFKFEGSDIDAFQLCKQSLVKSKSIIEKFLKSY